MLDTARTSSLCTGPPNGSSRRPRSAIPRRWRRWRPGSRRSSKAAGAERVWLVEHPPLYTAGTSASPSDLLRPDRFPVYRTGRGGQYTYHGPGQRVAYVMLDLNRRGPDLRRYVRTLEEWIIRTLAAFGVAGERRDGLIGVWVATPGRLREDRRDRHPACGAG